MPKMKTRSAAKKRFKKVSNGTKLKRTQAFRRHLLTKKNRKTKRDLRQNAYVSSVDASRIFKLLPY